jgi:hypothetical protein
MAPVARTLRCALLAACLTACELDTTDPIPDEPMTLVGADLQSRLWLVDETSGATTFPYSGWRDVRAHTAAA